MRSASQAAPTPEPTRVELVVSNSVVPVPRILVIDDDSGVRGVIRLFIEAAGYEVLDAGDATTGLALLERHLVDMVLCDLFMPGRDGVETIAQILENSPQMKIVAMSGGGRVALNLLPKARSLGAMEVLSKPFERASLLEVLRRVLDATPVAAGPIVDRSAPIT